MKVKHLIANGKISDPDFANADVSIRLIHMSSKHMVSE